MYQIANIKKSYNWHKKNNNHLQLLQMNQSKHLFVKFLFLKYKVI